MTGADELLKKPDSPTFLLFEGSIQEVTAMAYGWRDSELKVRLLRGPKMRTIQTFFDEIAAVLQFPWYFGENGNALDECLTDLSWLPPKDGYVLVVTNSGETLADADRAALASLVRSLEFAAGEWEKSVELGEAWDHAPVPFHVVLHTEVRDAPMTRFRWTAAGAEVSSLPA